MDLAGSRHHHSLEGQQSPLRRNHNAPYQHRRLKPSPVFVPATARLQNRRRNRTHYIKIHAQLNSCPRIGELTGTASKRRLSRNTVRTLEGPTCAVGHIASTPVVGSRFLSKDKVQGAHGAPAEPGCFPAGKHSRIVRLPSVCPQSSTSPWCRSWSCGLTSTKVSFFRC